jgi:hypothetical protein
MFPEGIDFVWAGKVTKSLLVLIAELGEPRGG